MTPWGLAAAGLALAYVLVAPSLPELHPPEASIAVAGCVGVTLVAAIAAAHLLANADRLGTLFAAGGEG